MALVPNALAQQLKAEAQFVMRLSALGIWDTVGADTAIITPLLNRADAVTEGDRQLAFVEGPNVIDAITILGKRRDLMGQAIGAVGDRQGYQASPTVYVIGAAEQPNGTTILTVVRKLNS